MFSDEVFGQYRIEYRVPMISGMETLSSKFVENYERNKEFLIEITEELYGVEHITFYAKFDYEILVDADDYLVLKTYHEEYGGWLHPMSRVEIYNLDPKTGERLGLEHFVGDKNKQVWRHLQAKADEISQAQYEIPPLEKEIHQFYVKDEVLYVTYNPYAIASYGEGYINFEIPLDELDNEVELWDRESAKIEPPEVELVKERVKTLWERIWERITDFFRWGGALWGRFWL